VIKFFVGICIGCLVYLTLTPSWELTIGSYIAISVFLMFFSALIGMPLFLLLSTWFNHNSIKLYALKIMTCIQLSFLIPMVIGRSFQVHMAKTKNLSQLGDMAMFTKGELSELGRYVVFVDFLSIFFAGLVATTIACIFEYAYRKKNH